MATGKQRRELHHDRVVARRVQRERERRGLSHEALARAVTDAGCLMHPSTPFKIERGDPPRRITMDEFVAFAKVFGLSYDEMLAPADEDEAEVRRLMDQYVELARDNDAPVSARSEIVEQLSKRLGGVQPATEALLAYVERTVLGAQVRQPDERQESRGEH